MDVVLGIESSCDETAVAIYSGRHGLLAHNIYSQIALHQPYGGVVPELASRDHSRKALPLVKETLKDSGLSSGDVDGVAYTQGPGLMGALMVGAALGAALGYGWGIPTVGVHHMEAHLMAALLEDDPPSYPFLALLVSGGHTLLVHVHAFGQYTVLGESLDDAVGEAFDKTAKLLGLRYPGGPHLAALAEQGDVERFKLTRPMINRPGLDFSFSGLKTQTRQIYESLDKTDQDRADIAAAFQWAVVETLVVKSRRALLQTGLDQLVVVGGVSANQSLRAACRRLLPARVFYPRLAFCTDNGAMVAYTGWLRLSRGERAPLSIKTLARWPMSTLDSP